MSVLVKNNQFVYRFTPEKKITDKITAMAAVEVFSTNNGKKIGGYGWSRRPDDDQVDYMVGEIIREYQLRQVWNR